MPESSETPARPSAPAPVTTMELDAVARRAERLYEQGHLEAARQLALEVATRRPDHVPALLTLGHVLREQGVFEDALAVLRRIGELSPGHVNAAAAYALTLFFKEDWPRAWQAFDVRFKFADTVPTVTLTRKDGSTYAAEPWAQGPPPASLLVMGEQGLGDTIQFARFLPQLAATGCKATCVIPRPLLRLFKTLECEVTFQPLQEGGGRVSDIGGWTPLLHLPRALAIGPENFVPRMPYLAAEPERVAYWRARLGSHGLRIGIVWQGNPDPRVDQGRSAPLSAFAPLAAIPNVRLISLQKGPGQAQIGSVAFAPAIEELGAEFDSGPDAFLDTAAVMQSLDLVVSVDTSVAHLAGALNRPVLILLKRLGAHWAWLYGRTDSVFYPSARLYRQRMPGAWDELLERVASDVGRLRPPTADLAATAPLVPVSIGELVDRLTILKIKCARIAEAQKLSNVERERAALSAVASGLQLEAAAIGELSARLQAVNERLWDIEDEIRACERRSDFGPRFIDLARAVYTNNDERARLKAEINRLSGSSLVEEKAYAAANPAAKPTGDTAGDGGRLQAGEGFARTERG
jgi:tetratricopeptide repeat protein/glycosyl transferase family 9 (putative heptosyltransferase)